MEPKTYVQYLTDFAWVYGPKLLTAIVILVAGLWIIRRLSRAFESFLRMRNVDESLRPFFASLVDVAMKVALLLVVAGSVGLETTSFIAVFSAVAFSVGLALQGSLGNFASGVLILLFKPYKISDLLTVNGLTGQVTEIQIFSTVLKTNHGITIVIPNSKMTEGAIEKITHNSEVQSHVSVLLEADSNLQRVREAAETAAEKCPWRLENHPTGVSVTGISRDDLEVDISWWTLGQHHAQNMESMYEALHTEFQNRGIKAAKERRREAM
ncbi:MAG: mechanosensitive ion channel family protein [Saprospiraceae bacterium]